jgi:SAM-dependent methyltransferase
MGTNTGTPLARRINDRYDSNMYANHADEFYGHSGFYNFGYWTDDTHDQREASENLVDRLVAMLPQKKGTILDVACGMGASSKRLLRWYHPRDVTAINISDKQLDTCRERAPGCRFLNMSATRLGFPDCSFDNILCVEACFHFDTREQFLREANRVLKPGGSLALSDLLLRTPAVAAMVPRIPVANYVPNLQEYEKLYTRCGFEDVRIIKAREECLGGHRDALLGFWWGKTLIGKITPVALQKIAAGLKLRDWVISDYLLVSARKPGGRR